MEARRLAILCSHLRPIELSPHHTSSLRFQASSHDDDDDRENGLRDTQKGKSLEDDCIFCKIIRGQSHAFKVSFWFLDFFFLLFSFVYTPFLSVLIIIIRSFFRKI